MIHSLSKGVTASCAFYDGNLGFPRCTRRGAASQASQLAYRISSGVDKKHLKTHYPKLHLQRLIFPVSISEFRRYIRRLTNPKLQY